MNFHAEAEAIAYILFGREGSETEVDVIEEALRDAYRAGALAMAGQTVRLMREPELTDQDAMKGLGIDDSRG